MAAIDKIYGTQEQYDDLEDWLKGNEKPIRCRVGMEWIKNRPIYESSLPSEWLYSKKGYDKDDRPISNFPNEIDRWLLKNCPLQWVTDKIKEQY